MSVLLYIFKFILLDIVKKKKYIHIAQNYLLEKYPNKLYRLGIFLYIVLKFLIFLIIHVYYVEYK